MILRIEATKFDRSRPLGSQNGEQRGLAAPELVALPLSGELIGLAQRERVIVGHARGTPEDGY